MSKLNQEQVSEQRVIEKSLLSICTSKRLKHKTAIDTTFTT